MPLDFESFMTSFYCLQYNCLQLSTIAIDYTKLPNFSIIHMYHAIMKPKHKNKAQNKPTNDFF